MTIGLWVALLFAGPFNSIPQDKLPGNIWKPPELTAADPEIRKLLDQTTSRCGQSDSGENIQNINKALEIADTRGLLGDKAIAEAYLGSAYVGRAEMELVFTNFQKALQDALEVKNKVLEADILISLASEAQLKGNVQRAIDLTSKALDISEKSGSLYEKARALGELGRLKLLLGKTDDGVQSIDEALKIDKLNGYRFLALHLVYRGYYLGLTKKPDEAIETLAEAKQKALALNDAYSFIMAENSYAFGLVQRGGTDEAITELQLIKQGDLQRIIQDSKEQVCFGAAFRLPILHLTLLEGLTNVLEAANRTSKELDVWTEALSYSHDHGILFGEAEAAQKVGNLDSQLENNDEALKYYAIAVDLYRDLQNEPLHAQVQVSQALLLIKLGRGKEAALLEQDVAAYAKRHNLRWPEFTAYGVLAEIYQPAGDLGAARDGLEKALSLVRPGPFDEEIDNRTVLQDYLRLADVYRGLKIPTRELVAIDEAFFVAVHLKDEKVQGNIVGYLDQRLKDLGIRELVKQRQQEGQLAEALLYTSILFTRDGMPKAGEDNSNWNRILNLPFLMAQTPEGAKALTQVLDQVDSFLGWVRVAMTEALSRYYITSGNDPILAEKYAIREEEITKGSPADITSVRAQRACILSIAYSRQFKNSLAKSKLSECSNLAKEANDEQSLKFAAIANALIKIANGEAASARDSLEQLLAKVPDDPELHVEFAMSLANGRLYDKAASELDLAVAKFTSKGERKAAAGAYVRVASALNSDNSAKAQELQLQYLRSGQHVYQELKAQAEEAAALTALGEYYLRLSKVEAAIEQLNKAFDLAQNTGRNDILAQALSDLGNANQAQKDYRKARDFHKRAAAAYHELKNPGLEAFCLQNLGRDYAAMNEPEEGLASFLEAKKVAALGPALTQYFVNLSLGEFYRVMGQFEKSLTIFRESVEITNQAGGIEHSAYSHLAIAELDTLIGNWEDAVVESEVALKLLTGHRRQGRPSSLLG
jgi:tetratricopeptide (TPR) repeat protein